MADENNLDVKEMKNCCDTNSLAKSEEISVETPPVTVMDVVNAEDVISVVSKDQVETIREVIELPKPQGVNSKRHSTGTIGARASKPQVQSRYRGNHQVASTHDLCKHEKRCNQQDAVKPWKMVRRKSVESSETVNVETPGAKPQSSVATKRDVLAVKKKTCASVNSESSSGKEDINMAKSVDGLSVKSPIDVTRLKSSMATKRDSLAVKKKLCASVNSESSSVQEEIQLARSVDGSSVKRNDIARKNAETQNILSRSAVIKMVSGLRSDKSYTSMEKISRISDGENSKFSAAKNKEKAQTQKKICGEDMKEKTVLVVESCIKGVQRQKQPSSEKKTILSGNESLNTTITTKQTGKISTGLIDKKESVSADVEANQKHEKNIRPKKTGVKVTLAKPLSFKRGKILEPQPEDSSPKWTKFRKRVVQELKTQTEGMKKNLKGSRLDVEKSDSCEGIKREKVVLRHQKVEGLKPKITLLNSVIEETVNKFTKMRKDKVKALIGAFETVISLQDTKTSHKSRGKATTSASKVSPLGSEQ